MCVLSARQYYLIGASNCIKCINLWRIEGGSIFLAQVWLTHHGSCSEVNGFRGGIVPRRLTTKERGSSPFETDELHEQLWWAAALGSKLRSPFNMPQRPQHSPQHRRYATTTTTVSKHSLERKCNLLYVMELWNGKGAWAITQLLFGSFEMPDCRHQPLERMGHYFTCKGATGLAGTGPK